MSFTRLSIILLLVTLLPSAMRADESLFHNRTLVIVVGLPGDMDSDKTYTDETLQLLNRCNDVEIKPARVLLLSNSMLKMDFESRYPFKVLPSDQKTFLGLQDELKDPASPPTFVIIGHGNHGQQPLFHVPGPRLTPDNFATVAKGCPVSTWLLFFSGSGNFAKALQAPKRTILATESDDRQYDQDPVSFALFLDLLDKNADLDKDNDLARLGDDLGPATNHWYQDRNLARTEEPALWINTDPPRKLIVPAAKVADVPAPPAPPTTPPAPAPATNSAPANPAPPTPAPVITLGPEWKSIQAVKPSDYPQADAVTLSRHESYQLGDDTQVTQDEETFVQILTRDGKRHGDFDFTFTPPEEDLTFLACEVRHPDGTLTRLDPDAIHDAAGALPEDVSPEQRKIFSLPQVEPGAILHVHLHRVWKRFPFPHVFEAIPLASEIPTLSLQVEMGVPDKEAFHFRFANHENLDPAIVKTGYGSVYTWTFSNLPALVDEPLRANESTPTLVITTFPDWAAFATWYSGLIRDSNQPSPELEAQARDLVSQAKTDRDKIAAIARFVTNFRYVAVPLGVNSFRPHAAVNVFQNRYGDCKDKANLLNTMLTSVGFKTNLVLVPRFSQAYDDLPGFAFNHAISAVQLDNQTLWIDSTDDVCRFGLLPPGDPGRKVLVIDGKTNTLAELPAAEAQDHRLTIDTKVVFTDSTGRTADVQITCATAGYADYLLRSSSKALGPAPIMPLLSAPLSPTTGAFEPSKQQATEAADLDQDFAWKALGAWPGLISRLPQAKTSLVRLPGWLPREWTVATLPRVTPLYLNQGYPMEIDQTWDLRLPANATSIALPEAQSRESTVLSWKLAWSAASANEVTAKLELTLLKADLTLEETRDFQASCHHLQEALQDGLSYQTP